VPAPIKLKPKFHKTFTEIVGKYGRMHEPELQIKLLEKTKPSALLHNASLVIRMFRKGKLKLRPSKLDRSTHFSEVFKKASTEETNK
jgi:hypothetical protein